MMEKKNTTMIPVPLVLLGLPLLFWALGDVPRRTVLKESLSLATLLSFTMMLGLFYLTRGARYTLTARPMRTVVSLHKIIGYCVVPILLLHPLFIVMPCHFESGITPREAFVTMITTTQTPGIVLGIMAWCLMLILGLTSLLRNKLPMTYQTWRLCHGLLSVIFVAVATWHALSLGRHMNRPMSTTLILLAAGGILLLLKTFIFKSAKDQKEASQ